VGHITSYMLGGFAAVASWSMVAPPDSNNGSRVAAAFQSFDRSTSSQSAINRAQKGDRLAPARPSAPRTVASIEVVGVHDAAIVYRDRNGNVLFRTDPVNNVTVIAKGVKLPDITVRHNAGTATRPLPVDVPGTAERSEMPIGCEPSVSPIASPRLSHVAGRCISEGERLVETASAAR
jgi:hypothetical protein